MLRHLQILSFYPLLNSQQCRSNRTALARWPTGTKGRGEPEPAAVKIRPLLPQLLHCMPGHEQAMFVQILIV
jgi:hypothetical protein